MPLRPFHKTFPVEILGRILSDALASPSDNPQKLPLPRPHPVSLLLVCKAVTPLLLPHFYRAIKVFKPQDWYTLFNTEYGVLGLDESDKPEDERRFPALAIRQGWVRELFLGVTGKGDLVGLPFDVEKAKTLEVDFICELDDLMETPAETLPRWLASTRLPGNIKVDLPHLVTMVTVPRRKSAGKAQLDVVLDVWREQLLDLLVELCEDVPAEVVLKAMNPIAAVIATAEEASAFKILGLLSRLTAVHLPVDESLSAKGVFSPLEAIYKAANNAELFAYVLKASTVAGHLPALTELLDGVSGTSFVKNIVLVGTPSNIRLLAPAMPRNHIGLQWLAPDGQRRNPSDARDKKYDAEKEEEATTAGTRRSTRNKK